MLYEESKNKKRIKYKKLIETDENQSFLIFRYLREK